MKDLLRISDLTCTACPPTAHALLIALGCGELEGAPAVTAGTS